MHILQGKNTKKSKKRQRSTDDEDRDEHNNESTSISNTSKRERKNKNKLNSSGFIKSSSAIKNAIFRRIREWRSNFKLYQAQVDTMEFDVDDGNCFYPHWNNLSTFKFLENTMSCIFLNIQRQGSLVEQCVSFPLFDVLEIDVDLLLCSSLSSSSVLLCLFWFFVFIACKICTENDRLGILYIICIIQKTKTFFY